MPRSYEVPEYNEAVMCPECGEKSEVYTGMYGLFGGGIGPYTICADCGQIVTKSFDDPVDKAIDGEFTEVNDERRSIEKDKG